MVLDRPMLFVASARHEAARHFYEETLGLRFVADEPFALVFDVAGTQLRIQKVESLTPAPFTALGWAVEDVAGTIDELTARGVVMERFAGMEQDDRGIWSPAPGVAVAWFKDPDGNVLSLASN